MAKIVVTGIDEVDQAFEGFKNAMRNKFLRDASRKVTKEIVLVDFRTSAPKNKGVMTKVATVRATKRSRVRIGHQVVIDDEKLYSKYEAHYGRRPKIKGRDFFYPAALELGKRSKAGGRFLTKSLYDNSKRIFREYIESVKQSARLGGKKVTIPRQLKGRLGTREFAEL